MIPAQVDEISVNWLNNHLGNDVGTVGDVAIEHIGEGVGIGLRQAPLLVQKKRQLFHLGATHGRLDVG